MSSKSEEKKRWMWERVVGSAQNRKTLNINMQRFDNGTYKLRPGECKMINSIRPTRSRDASTVSGRAHCLLKICRRPDVTSMASAMARSKTRKLHSRFWPGVEFTSRHKLGINCTSRAVSAFSESTFGKYSWRIRDRSVLLTTCAREAWRTIAGGCRNLRE